MLTTKILTALRFNEEEKYLLDIIVFFSMILLNEYQLLRNLHWDNFLFTRP